MKCIAMIALTALIATPALADRTHSPDTADQAASAPANATAGGKEERKICRRFENTASRMKAETLCMTKEEWRKYQDEQ
jgi:hypothetical protein